MPSTPPTRRSPTPTTRDSGLSPSTRQRLNRLSGTSPTFTADLRRRRHDREEAVRPAAPVRGEGQYHPVRVHLGGPGVDVAQPADARHRGAGTPREPRP